MKFPNHAQTKITRPGAIDVLIVTAVKDECDRVLRFEPDWEEAPDPDPSGFPYHIRRDPDGLSWALARAVDMGADHAATVATRLVAALRPRCLAMVGVCAGWRARSTGRSRSPMRAGGMSKLCATASRTGFRPSGPTQRFTSRRWPPAVA